MSKLKQIGLITTIAVSFCVMQPAISEQVKTKEEKNVQAQVVLTVSESKRLIAKAISQMYEVKEALKNGMVIIAKGTTNSYVAEEILGKKIPHGAYVYGRTYPAKGGKKLEPVEHINEIILIKGKLQEGLSLADAVRKLKAGDVVFKGANAIDYENKLAGVITSGGDDGTTGKLLPYVVARKARLIIPVGLEKQVSANLVDIVKTMGEPVESLNNVPSMFLLAGQIVTEIEAIKVFADVEVCHVASGGIGGAEGAVRLIIRGRKPEVQKALKLISEIQGEPPFVQ